MTATGLLLGVLGVATAADWRDLGPFQADAADLRVAADAHADEPVGMLLDERVHVLGDDQVETYTHRQVYVVNDPASLDAWMTVHIGWYPLYQDMPEISARVLGPDGTMRDLDPTTLLVEGPDRPEAPGQIWEKSVRVILPGPEPGAVAEVVSTTKRRWGIPADAGYGATVYFAAEAPTDLFRLRVESPLPLKGQGPDDAEITADGNAISLSMRDIEPPPPEAWAPWLDSDLPVFVAEVDRPVRATTARLAETWAEHLTTDGLEDLTRCAADRSRREAAACLLGTLHDRVEVFPIRPSSTHWQVRSRADVLGSGLANAAEASLLYTAMLRAAGLPAELVLAEATAPPHPDPLPDYLGFYDYPLVYVPGDEPLWADLHTPGGALGELFIRAMDRPAVSLSGTALTTPGTVATQRNTYVYDATGAQRAVSHTLAASGWLARRFRTFERRARRDSQLSEGLMGALRQSVGDPNVPNAIVDGMSHGATTFSWTVETEESTALLPSPGQTLVRPPPDAVGTAIPALDAEELQVAFEDGELDIADRLLPLTPYEAVAEARVKLPPDHDLLGVPAELSATHGGISLSRSLSYDDGAAVVTLKVTSTGGTIRQADVVAARAALEEFGFGDTTWEVQHDALTALDRSEVAAAVALMQESATDHPYDVHVGVARAMLLSRMGHPEAALDELAHLAETHPEHPAPAFAMVAPIFDEALSPNADADEEAMRRYLAQLDKALAGDPTNPVFLGIRGFTAATLARMHLREPAVLEEMIPYMAAAIEVPPSNDETLSAYGTSLYVLGRADELRGLLSDPDVFGSNLPGLAVAAVTKTSGADAGLSMLEVAVPAAQFRARPLVEASIALMLEGDYDAAATLVRAAADAMPTSTPILDLRRVMNNIAALKPLKPKDPLTALEGATDAITEMADALSFAAVPVSDDDAARSMIDLFRAVTVREVRGDKKAGYLVVAEADEDSIGGSFDNGTTWFLASRDKEGWHHLASPGAEGWRIGEVLFDRIEADDPHVVRLWREIDDLIEPNSVAHGLFTRIWSGTMDPEDPAVRRFGAALLAAENYRPDVLDAVEEGLPLVADEQTRFALLAALVWWNQQAERPEAVARLAVGLPEEGVISGYGVRSWALQETGDLAGAEALMRDAVADNPESSEYRDMLGLFLARTGRVDEALDVFEEGAELQEITANFYNNHAWVTLLAGRSEEAAELASLGLRRSGEARAESLLHTYAAAQADLGKVDEAWEAFQDARGVVESGEGDASSMGDHWWYVLGRIAESVGMPTEAATAYRKVEQDDGPMATWKLSERRLKALGETP